MAQKHQRGNREAKKPKQDKTKVVAPTTPFPTSRPNTVKGSTNGKNK
jgi:hypothetical protein